MTEISEKEIEAAMSGWHRALIDAPNESVYERRRRCIRAALEAASSVRAENDAFRDAVVTGLGAVKINADGTTERVDLRAEANAGKSHPDDEAVDRFAAAMKAKLKWEREERGRYGWNDPKVCSEEYLAKLLIEHLAKGNEGNFEDIANFCMMLHQRGAHPRVLAAAFATAGTPGAALNKESQNDE